MNMPSRAVITASAAVLALSSLTLSSSATAGKDSPRIPVLRTRTLVLKGTASGYVDVRIPRPTVIDASLSFRRGKFGPNRHTRIAGEGPFTGVLIAPVSDKLGKGASDFTIVLGQFEGCSFGCTEARRVNYAHPLGAGNIALPADDYRIYFMTGPTASRLAVTFLRGPKGKTFMTPANPIHVSAAVPAAVDSSTANSFSAGADYEMPADEGIRLSVMDVILEETGSDGTYGSCLYQSQPDTPDESKFQPGCPEGTPPTRRITKDGSGMAAHFYTRDYEFMYGAGPWAFGMWNQTSIPMERVVHGVVFLGI